MRTRTLNIRAEQYGTRRDHRLEEILHVPTLVDADGNPVRGRCADTDPEMFFSDSKEVRKAAELICWSCPVKASCLQIALDNQEKYGIWGGKPSRGLRGRPTAVSMDRRREMWSRGCSDREIADELGLSEITVKEWRQNLGLPSHFAPAKSTPLTDAQQMQRIDLYQQGLNDSEIAQAVGVTAAAIRSWRKARSLAPNQVPGKPVRHTEKVAS